MDEILANHEHWLSQLAISYLGIGSSLQIELHRCEGKVAQLRHNNTTAINHFFGNQGSESVPYFSVNRVIKRHSSRLPIELRFFGDLVLDFG